MTATDLRRPAPLEVQEAAFAQLQLDYIPTASSFRLAVFHARRAMEHGASFEPVFDALEAWIPEGLS